MRLAPIALVLLTSFALVAAVPVDTPDGMTPPGQSVVQNAASSSSAHHKMEFKKMQSTFQVAAQPPKEEPQKKKVRTPLFFVQRRPNTLRFRMSVLVSMPNQPNHSLVPSKSKHGAPKIMMYVLHYSLYSVSQTLCVSECEF
jgi:hypothetical protein